MTVLVPLGHVISLEYGKSLPANSRLEGDVPVYGSNGQTGWHNEALIEGPSLIVGRKGSIGQVHYRDGPSFPIDTTYYVKSRPGVTLDFKFAFYMLREAKLTDLNSATGVPGLNREHAYRVMTRLPSLQEQRRIVGLLDRAAEIRRRADAARANARAIIPAVFLDMFGDPATNPKGWPRQALGELINKIIGGKNIEAGNGSSPYQILRVSAVTSGYFRPEEAKPAPDGYQPLPEHHIRKGDFLFSRANTSALVGAVAIVENDNIAGLLLPDKIWRIEWRQEAIEPRFAYSLLRSKEIRRIFAQIASGTSDSMKNISQRKLGSIDVPIPPLPLQTAYARQAERLEGTASALDTAAAKAEAMAAALSAQVFG